MYERLEDSLKRKPKNIFPRDIVNERKLLSTGIYEDPVMFGSYIYRYSKYPGDIDFIERVITNSRDETIRLFSKKIKEIVRSILSKREHYYSEFKCGIDKRYEIKIGYMQNGYYKIDKNLPSNVGSLYSKKLIEKNDYFIMSKIFELGDTQGQNSFDTIMKILRNYYILRWTAQEIIDGRKILIGNKIIKLEEALEYNTLVKIDEIALINKKFIEVTNIYSLKYLEKGKEEPESISAIFNSPIMTLDIEKLYYSNMYYVPLKMCKRIYSLARHMYFATNDSKWEIILQKMSELLLSDIALLHQIKSDYETSLILLQKYDFKDYDLLFGQFDSSKNSLSNVLVISNEKLIKYSEIIDEIINSKNKKDMIKLIDILMEEFSCIINFYTIKFLSENGLNPPPSIVLPTPETITHNIPNEELLTKKSFVLYNRRIHRNPTDNPKEEYDDFLDNLTSKTATPIMTPMLKNRDDEELETRLKAIRKTKIEQNIII